MSEPKDHINPYTAADIQRYHQGGMSSQERHELEKAALDDPFLADALEGYAFTQTPAEDLAALRGRLKQQLPALVVPMRFAWLKAAAIVAFVAGAGWLAWTFITPPQSSIALEPPPPAAASKAQPDSALPTIPPSSDRSDHLSSEAAEPAPDPTPDPVPRTLEAPVRSEPEVAPALPPAASRSETPTRENSSIQNRRAFDLANKAKGPNVFQMRVVDAQSNAIPNATVSVPGQQPQTGVTDNAGYFTVNSQDSAVVATVTAPGFEANQVALNSRSNTVVMTPDNNSLSEVVVVGYGKKSSSDRPNMPVPVPGWAFFHNYVANALKELKDPELEDVTGEVELSFEVDRSGQPVNIRVKNPLCARCDEEAVRLLREGPKWKRKNSRQNKSTVTIRFD